MPKNSDSRPPGTAVGVGLGFGCGRVLDRRRGSEDPVQRGGENDGQEGGKKRQES